MRRALSFLVAAWFVLAGSAWAQQLQAIPPLSGRIVDAAAWLTDAERQRLEPLLAGEEARSGAQLAILIVPTTKPEPIEAYSIRVVDAWKLGRRGVDDGILFLVARDDRTLRIEVGRGLEGVVPDAVAKQIIEDQMLPAFRRGAAAEGLQAGITAVLARLAGEALPPPSAPPVSRDDGEDNWLGWLLMALFLGGPILRSLLGSVPGALVGAGGVGAGVGWLTGSLLFGLGAAVMAFIFLIGGGRGGGGPGPWISSGRSGGGFSGGGWSGGGGGFSGGGASGRW